MFQKEVAERIVAKPDTGAYGRLAVLAQWRSTPRIALHRPPLGLRAPAQGDVGGGPYRTGAAADGVAIKTLESLTASAFGQRRKMLRQSLKSLPGGLAALEKVGIDPTRRAETLSVDEFVSVARAMR
jgi:16S rRNA (adenine1518-N6/adenine1519-N6)-dimethyltransferase